MKISALHDGSGNFCMLPLPQAPTEKDSPALRMLLFSILAGIGQALLFEAGKALTPLPRLWLTMEGNMEGQAEDGAFTQEGLYLTIEAEGVQSVLERLSAAALAACFPAGTLACPLHHIVIARS